MLFNFNETHEEIIKLSKDFANGILKPLSEEYDDREEFPLSLLEEYKKSGFYSILYPEEYGGINAGLTGLCLCIEELSKVDGSLALPPATSALGAIPMILYANEEQRKKYFPLLASGEKLAAFALTEPEAGSDATSITTQAKKEGDYYLINGMKHFCSSGNISDIYIIFAKTAPEKGARGISCFAIDKNAEGFKIGKKEKKLGIKSNPTTEIFLENVRVSKNDMIGPEGFGLFVLQETFDYSRPGVAAQAIGIAEGALEITVKYLKQRKQFGQSIISFQAVSHKIAELATKLEAAKSFLYLIVSRMDESYTQAFENAIKNQKPLREELKKISKERWTKYSAMIKLYASDIAFDITQECVNLCGGMGYMRSFGVEKFMRDAKVTQIYEGSNNIQKNEIALQISKEY
ncbi:MAG: acyl-CoA dehydrogenase family protein [Elusimicrobiales bacterium]|nr:acyl-CoA dehydrogenase family protein [Elusimicrobiales bacterium]HPO95949.1 acyl-CoA dehydrogenase family protein [Elusimicrobiales bacterium]